MPVLWVALLLAACYAPGMNLFSLLERFTVSLQTPFAIRWTAYSLRTIAGALAVYGLLLSAYYSARRNERPGEEHGTARWANPREINARYADRKHPDNNIILTQHVSIGMDTHKHRRALNFLVIGGSGSGKSRSFAIPSILGMSCSYIVCDPKGEILRKTGAALRANGYDVRALDLVNMERSDSYNPFRYIENEEDIAVIVNNFIKNTTPAGQRSQDPFWEKSENLLYSAIISLLYHEYPDELNFETILYMLSNGGASDEDESFLSPLDVLFEDLEREQPRHPAAVLYKSFKLAPGKTRSSIFISAVVRLTAFNLPLFARITERDDLDLGGMGDRKRALFIVTSDSNSAFDFLVGLLYTTAFQALLRRADSLPGGRLPVHVRFVMDEFANTANVSPDEFLKIHSVIRSREISTSIIIQNMAQLKKLFGQEAWENIVGNSSAILYLGGNEAGTHTYLSQNLLGKSTLDTRTTGQTKGQHGSYTTNYQTAARELLTPDEVRRLDSRMALLLISGEHPVFDGKYDLKRHPRIGLTEDGGADAYVHTPARPYVEPLFDMRRLHDYIFD